MNSAVARRIAVILAEKKKQNQLSGKPSATAPEQMSKMPMSPNAPSLSPMKFPKLKQKLF